MSLTNPSQVLLRNAELLSATNPLLINMPADNFIEAYLELNQKASISCYNTNYSDYMALKTQHRANTSVINTLFASTYQSEIKHDLVILLFPKSKAELAFTLATIAPYLAENCRVLLVGEKKGGIQSTPKLSQHFLNNCQKIDAARHCWLFAGIVSNEMLSKVFNLEDWFKKYEITIDNIKLTIASLPGVFSQQKLDLGTSLLLKNLPKNITGEVLDFGCGAGVISCFIGKKYPKSILSLLDVSALALTSAEKTLSLNGLQATVFPSNSLSDVKRCYHYIVSNPPFHQGVSTNYQATEDFLSGIKEHLERKGMITIVANSFLRYQPIMQQHIGNTEALIKAQGFTVYQSQYK
jgi:16S rRNA (guanine1207-N2)-methyltransferase